jgi:hypothetical protein
LPKKTEKMAILPRNSPDVIDRGFEPKIIPYITFTPREIPIEITIMDKGKSTIDNLDFSLNKIIL